MKKTIVIKNSLWVRHILRTVYHYIGHGGGIVVSKEVDADEYLMILPLDTRLIDAHYTYMSCNREYYERYLKDNSYCVYLEYVNDFITMMNNKLKI